MVSENIAHSKKACEISLWSFYNIIKLQDNINEAWDHYILTIFFIIINYKIKKTKLSFMIET